MFYFLAVLTVIALAISWETKSYTDSRAASAAVHGLVAAAFGAMTLIVWLVEQGRL